MLLFGRMSALGERLAYLDAGGSLDLLDGQLYVDGSYDTWKWMRQHSPVHWDEHNELWGIFKFDDIIEIERRKDVFSSADTVKGGYRPNMPADPSIIGLDDPLHQKRRHLVARWFTPSAITEWEKHVDAVVTELLDAMVAKGGRVEVVTDLAGPLPAKMIGRLLGYAQDRYRDLMRWSETTIALGGGPAYRTEEGANSMMEFAAACAELYQQRVECPAHDVMTVWTTAEVDGQKLGLAEVISDCLLLLDGGAETTRTVLARTLLNLVKYPDQWRKLQEGVDMVAAVEEMVRFVTPVHNMCRTATEDFEIRGTTIRKGQQVVMMYASANRDEEHFADGDVFDVTRPTQQHLAFGFGTHFCMGRSLALLEIRRFFEELLKRVRGISIVDGTTPVEMANPFVYGIKEAHLQFDLR